MDFFASLKTDAAGDPDPSKIVMAGIIAPDNGIRYEYGEIIEPSCNTFEIDENGDYVIGEDGLPNTIGRGYSGYRYIELIESWEDLSKNPSKIRNTCSFMHDSTLSDFSSYIVDITGR